MRAWLRSYAVKHPCHGFRRAWAALRYDERREVNKKKIHRLWREEGLQVRVRSPRKRAGSPRYRRSWPTRRTWCGRSTSSSTPLSTARRSRSRR
ncbi:IS3 family transposase [Mycolicibacterium confluentis]|uniref:IS3 family transposase n=1 Tax=Mycolicibacterium confluentis TaxID=28047 RepID=UPI00389909FF